MPDTVFPVVVFDLDGTLLRGTTVSLPRFGSSRSNQPR
jgi:hypothetical protein